MVDTSEPPFSRYILNGFDGLLCLTKRAAKAFRDRTNSIPVEFIPWYADPHIFKRKENVDGEEEYFSSGQTCATTPPFWPLVLKWMPNSIIAPKESAGRVPVPPNVEFVEIIDPRCRYLLSGARLVCRGKSCTSPSCRGSRGYFRLYFLARGHSDGKASPDDSFRMLIWT